MQEQSSNTKQAELPKIMEELNKLLPQGLMWIQSQLRLIEGDTPTLGSFFEGQGS